MPAIAPTTAYSINPARVIQIEMESAANQKLVVRVPENPSLALAMLKLSSASL